jgi:hypothetical protein
MKDLQGMVRSLIGTVADQHDATEEIRRKLHEKPAPSGLPAPLINLHVAPIQKPAQVLPDTHNYENAIDNKYGHLAPAPAQSQAAATPSTPVLNDPVKEFVTPIHAYFKPGLPSGVTPSVPNIPQKPAIVNQPPPEFDFSRSEAVPAPPTRKFNKPDWDSAAKIAPPKLPSVTSFERMHMQLTKRHQEQALPPQDNFDTRSLASVATSANQTFISEVTSEYQAAVGKRDESQISSQYYENCSVSGV